MYAVKKNLACEAVLSACKEYAEVTSLEEIRFVLFSDDDYTLFSSKLNKGTDEDVPQDRSSGYELKEVRIPVPIIFGALCRVSSIIWYVLKKKPDAKSKYTHRAQP